LDDADYIYVGEVKDVWRSKTRAKAVGRTTLRDLNSGERVEIISPGSFELEAVLLDSAYYKFRGKEYRFLLSKAREFGLKVA
jgi:hypothetical protein